MNIKEEEKVHKSKLNSIEVYKTIKTIPTNKNILFYRKSFLKNNKTSYYYHKKGNNSSNITPNSNNSYISGYKKPQKSLNYSNEEANQSTKGKTINCSKSKSKYDEITPEKYILNDKSISPLSIDSNNYHKDNKNSSIKLNNKENKSSLIKGHFNRKRENLSLNYASKIHSISIVNNELKRNIKYDECLNNNKEQHFNFRPKRIKAFRNKVKKPNNISFKTDKNKGSIDLLSHNIVQNIHNSLNKYNNYNNTNTIIINNTIKRNNNNYSKSKKSQLTINNNVFDINNINNIENSKRNLVKGKIIKFKYNGTEFFFEPVHNKTESYFYKKNTKYTRGELITASNSIKKWWKQISFLNMLLLKIKIKYGMNLINKIKIKRIFRYIKYKVLYLNEVIYIQKQWKQFINIKKEQTSVYKKNDTYGCDNSYRKNNEFLSMNSFEYLNSLENNNSNEKNNNKIYSKKNKIKKKADLLNKFFLVNLSNQKFITPKNETINNEVIIKNNCKNICFYSKLKVENNLEKIIFIQRKIRIFLKQKYYSFIKNIFKELYSNKNNNKQIDNNTIKEKEKNLKIEKQSFDIISQKNGFKKNYSVIKIDSFDCSGLSPKQKEKIYHLDINKNNQITFSSKAKKSKLELIICKNPYIELIPVKGKTIAESKNEINFSIIKRIQKEDNINSIINKPIINSFCFYEKIKITNGHINSIIKIQKFFRENKNIKNDKFICKKIIQKHDCFITKIHKNNKTNLHHILKIQKIFKRFLTNENNTIIKPINKTNYMTKTKKKATKIKRYYKFIKNNSSFNTISPKESNKNQIYFNNIDEFLYDKEGEKINDVTKYNTINNSRRKLNKERKNNFLNDTDENRNENPIKIMNAKIHKSSINFNTIKITNLKSVKNNYTPKNSNKYINIESLPSINSLKTNTENNDIFSLEQNKLNNNKIQNNITSISIQTLGSNLSKNKFRENIKYIKRMTTEGNNHNKQRIEYDIKNYFYTDNDIAKFNEEGYLLVNSIERKNTKNYFRLIRYINQRIIKVICYQIKEIKKQKCLYIFIQMIIQRIKKYINVLAFSVIFDKYNKNEFYKITRKHIIIYNKITNDINIKNKYKNNELIVLLKENIYKEYFNNKFLFLYDEQEKNLIDKDVFISNDKDLINYFLLYYKYENKPIDNNYFNLIQFRLIKDPLYNMNIFSITKYMETLYNNIIHGNICKTCFCKIGESCSINCNCHIRQQNSINLINKIKNKITHHKSFNESNKENNSFLEEKNKHTQRNIRIIIKKVKRTSADTTRTRYDNSEQSSDSKNSYSNEIDIFQKMNAGIESIINKVKINKAFKDFNLNKKKKIDRTTTEFNGLINQTKIYSDGIDKVKNHFTTPNKKNSSFLIEKKLLNEK